MPQLELDSLETDFIKAQQQDHENLKARCRTLSRSQRLVADLVAAAGYHYEVKELAMAFTKVHTSIDTPTPSRSLLLLLTACIQGCGVPSPRHGRCRLLYRSCRSRTATSCRPIAAFLLGVRKGDPNLVCDEFGGRLQRRG